MTRKAFVPLIAGALLFTTIPASADDKKKDESAVEQKKGDDAKKADDSKKADDAKKDDDSKKDDGKDAKKDSKPEQTYSLELPKRALPPWVFFGAVGLSVGLGVVTSIFYANTASLHDDFVKDRTNEAISEEGSQTQIRTRFLVSATALVTVATAILGITAIDWSGGQPAKATTSK